MIAPFRLAYHVTDLAAAREFYCSILGCREGRSSETWLDVDFFGHQLSLHLGQPFPVTNTGRVGEHMVPMPHLGVVLPMVQWRELADRLSGHDMTFVLAPSIRLSGKPGEQATMFFCDPSGNPIEIKGFDDMSGEFQS